MARSRNIKPSLFKNELLGVSDPLHTVLFIGLWTIADREGRLEDRPMRIKAEVFPYRDGLSVEPLLQWLHKHGFIVRYVVEGRACIQIVNFAKHQNPHKNEVESDIPEMSRATPEITGAVCEDSGAASDFIGTAPADSLLLIPDSLNTDSLKLNPDSLTSLEPQAASKPAAVEHPDELADVDPFPCVGMSKEYRLTQSLMATWVKAYPNLDVLAEMRKAQAWCVTNASNRKTTGGMPKFLNSWLCSATNGPNRGPPRAPPPKLPTSKLSDQLRERMKR